MNHPLLAGTAAGTVIVLEEPLSMWGGLDPATGEIIDRRHPQSGLTVTGSILALPHGRGSSSAASVLAEAIRLRTAPAAILLAEPDDIILLGALVAEEMYGLICPIVEVDAATYAELKTGMTANVAADGTVGHQAINR